MVNGLSVDSQPQKPKFPRLGIEAVGKFVCDLFKEDLFKLKFYSVKTSS
jgi:hypothetical protein